VVDFCEHGNEPRQPQPQQAQFSGSLLALQRNAAGSDRSAEPITSRDPHSCVACRTMTAGTVGHIGASGSASNGEVIGFHRNNRRG
jgi:hypothetical protein